MTQTLTARHYYCQTLITVVAGAVVDREKGRNVGRYTEKAGGKALAQDHGVKGEDDFGSY